MTTDLSSNIFNTALIFEGGSMRAAYSSAVATLMLERGLFFDTVYGISAGSSNAVNYLSRDLTRTATSFTTFIGEPEIGDTKTFLHGKGLFNAHFIYQEAGLPGGCLPYDFETFQANPADLRVLAINGTTARDVTFTKADMPRLEDLMIRVRASSTLPVFMPAPLIDGHPFYDGGFTLGGGLPLTQAFNEGFEKVFVVRTRKRGYRKSHNGKWERLVFARHPHMREAALSRWWRYNMACDKLDQLEAQGKAYVFYCDDLTLEGTERDVSLLQENFDAGYAQAQREFDDWQRFLEL